MEQRKIKCPHCEKEMDIELVIQNIEKIEMGVGIKVTKPEAGKKATKKKN